LPKATNGGKYSLEETKGEIAEEIEDQTFSEKADTN